MCDVRFVVRGRARRRSMWAIVAVSRRFSAQLKVLCSVYSIVAIDSRISAIFSADL